MTKRKIEIFSAGCPACDDVVNLVNKLACPSCEIIVHDMHDKNVQVLAKNLGIKSVPAVSINGVLAGCCQGRGVNPSILKNEGIGTPLD
jgi:glutaredoxin 3